MPKSPPKKRVLITGGTGSVGQALCETFARSNYKVTLQYRSQKDCAERIAKKLRVQLLEMDFEKNPELLNVDFDIVINNAGINETGCYTHEVEIGDWSRAFLVNVTIPFIFAKQCLPGMKKRKWGRIINISSIYGLKGVEGRAPYTASKHALSGLTKTIAREYSPFGITCNEICPGPVESEMMNRIAKENSDDKNSTHDFLAEVCEEIPAGRMAKPQDIANLALFLASDKASYLTGASITLDGGMIA